MDEDFALRALLHNAESIRQRRLNVKVNPSFSLSSNRPVP
jgi:hypothetical protein